MIGFDQRGTGASGLLRCRALERDERLRSTVAAERCARQLGARRAFYTTPDSVADMEAIRKAVGARKLTLFGISYGTELGLAYARAYPERVDRLILDSVVDPDESDPFGLAGFRAMGPSLASLCPDGCRDLSTDPAADLAALIAKLRVAPLSGAWYDARGRRRTGTLRPIAIADLLYDADYNPALRAGVPMAVRAALDNDDAAPLLRLMAASTAYALPSNPRDFSSARYAAVCEETPLPWPRGTGAGRPPGGRARSCARAAADRVRAVRRRGRLRGRDRPLPALARSRPSAARGRRRLSRGADAAAAGAGGPAHAAGGLRARRDADRRRAARHGAGDRARRDQHERLRSPPAAALRRGRGGAHDLSARTDRRARDGRAAGVVRRARAGRAGWRVAWGGR